METPGTTPDQPLFMKFVRDEDGTKWGNIILALSLTVISGYLATQSQRAGSDPDFMRTIRMRCALTVKHVADAQAEFWTVVSNRAATAYQRARV